VMPTPEDRSFEQSNPVQPAPGHVPRFR